MPALKPHFRKNLARLPHNKRLIRRLLLIPWISGIHFVSFSIAYFFRVSRCNLGFYQDNSLGISYDIHHNRRLMYTGPSMPRFRRLNFMRKAEYEAVNYFRTFEKFKSMIELFALRFLINLFFTFLVIRFIYYPQYKNKDFVFTFFLFNSILFVLCFLLAAADLKFGFAFGLFAMFSMFRYRTVTVPIGEMGYFFLVVTLGIINSIASLENYAMLILANSLLVGVTFLLGRFLTLTHENFQVLTYENLALVKPDQKAVLLQDLIEKTGQPIHRVQVVKVDYQRGVAQLKAYYYSKDNETFSADAEA